MTTEEILALRKKMGWVSPLSPLEKGDRTLMFSQRGQYEWMMHPDEAFMAVLEGVQVDGLLLECQIVDCFPLMNALMVQAKAPDGNKEFVPGHRILNHRSKIGNAEFIGHVEQVA